VCAFLYFDVSFMVWQLLGALANFVSEDFRLDDAQKGLMVAVPMLGGALLRLVLGVLTDHWGARRTAILGLLLTLVPLSLGCLWADSFAKVLLVALLLGVAGASFAAALPLASRWYPPEHQGIALGIAGAGNSGVALATFFGPRLVEWLQGPAGLGLRDELKSIFGMGLAQCWGWHAVFGVALVPLVATLVVFALFAKNSPVQPPPKRLADYAVVLAQRDTWWFCLFYSVTFGGFVGFAGFLTTFFRDQYALSRVSAGSFATLCVVAGSFLRPLGGYLADRFGGIRLLTTLFVGVGLMMLGLAALPPLGGGTVLMFLAMGLLGMGNGSVFQLVPQRFPKEIGVLTGIVGAAGGVGGFFLPNLLGGLKHVTGSFTPGLLVASLAGFGCALALTYVGRTWEGSFVGQCGLATSLSSSSPQAPAEVEAGASV
jgi:NNP family nitrate/nitrite transporter-like MFS transporter